MATIGTGLTQPADKRLSMLTDNTDILTTRRYDFMTNSFAFIEVSGGMLGGSQGGVKEAVSQGEEAVSRLHEQSRKTPSGSLIARGYNTCTIKHFRYRVSGILARIGWSQFWSRCQNGGLPVE